MDGSRLDCAKLRLITFDCYGTLIDWESGIRRALARVLGSAGVDWDDRFFNLYLQREAHHERQPYRTYREILVATERDVLAGAGLPPTKEPQLPESLSKWPRFDDTVGALQRLSRRYKLGILSNVDRDLFSQTNKLLEVQFDIVITAQDVNSYKPGLAHFTRLREAIGVGEGEHLHVAQSLYHDIMPCTQLGIDCAWVNRRSEQNLGAARPLAEFPDLASLADAVL